MPTPTTKKPEKKAEKPKEKTWVPDTPDAPDAIIPAGAPCTHNGCKATYKDESSRTETCHYHPGEAEFHEGSKGIKVINFRLSLQIQSNFPVG